MTVNDCFSGVLKEQKNTELHVPGCQYLNATRPLQGEKVIPYPEPTPGTHVCFVAPEFASQKSEVTSFGML